MDQRIRGARIGGVLVALALTVTLAACGSSGSSGDAASLLKQTFGQAHTRDERESEPQSERCVIGIECFKPSDHRSVSVVRSRAAARASFQRRTSTSASARSAERLARHPLDGDERLRHVRRHELSASGGDLPAARVELRLDRRPRPARPATRTALSKLGIDPLHWLVNPSVVGTETIGGADTTHIKANVNVPALLGDLNTFLTKAVVDRGRPAPRQLPRPALRRDPRAGRRRAIKNPSVDVWTGNGDKIVRKLVDQAHAAGVRSGLERRSAASRSAPRSGSPSSTATSTSRRRSRPPSMSGRSASSQRQLQSFLAAAGGGASGGSSSAGSSSAGSSSPGSSAGSSAPVARPRRPRAPSYIQCIQAAGQDVTKMQKCAGLLNRSAVVAAGVLPRPTSSSSCSSSSSSSRPRRRCSSALGW